VLNFEYDNNAPWPTLPDGEGYSLTFSNPNLPNSSDGSLWTSSSIVGGTPGRGEKINEAFASWMSDRGESNPMNTKDGEIYNNLLTYAFGLDLGDANRNSTPSVQVIESDGNLYLALEYQKRSNATGLNYVIEYSQNLQTWLPANENDIITSEEVISENITGISVRIRDNLNESSQRFMRIRVLVE
jgi:hypothetical protein